MIIHYGYTDGIGEFYISIDDSICNGCMECINECPEKILENYFNGNNEKKVKVKSKIIKKIGYVCPGKNLCGKCIDVCEKSAIKISW